KPPVIDLEELLQPITEENPSGESLRYAGTYDEIAESRRADDDVPQGEWRHELKTADFRKVIELATDALKNKSKDLQIAAWFSEALTKQYGFAGLRDSLKLAAGFQENFWETLFPEIDEGDMEGRANALEWLDRETALAVKRAPITAGEGLSFWDWEESKKYDIPENIETLDSADQERYNELKEQAEKENRVTGVRWRKAKTQTRRAFCEETAFILDECWTEYENLNRVMEEKFDPNQLPGLNELKKTLDDIKMQVKKLLDEKKTEEPDAADETLADADEGAAEEIAEDGSVMVRVSKGAINSRQDALKRLTEVSEFFRKTEPHSPVSYLVSRAVKWGNMPLEQWLQDVIKDENVIHQLRQTLGFETGQTEDEYSSSDSYYSGDESSETS
ncbi:MAG: type VI secretion system protein TssA, partial [Pyrinomonadaceae bacterium]